MADKVQRYSVGALGERESDDGVYVLHTDIAALHASIIEQGRKVLNATSDKGMSHSEYIEWVMGRLEEK